MGKIVPPPPPASKRKPPVTVGENYALEKMFKGKAASWAKYKGQIIQTASYYGLDPVTLVALLVRENAPAQSNPNNPQASGWVQIADKKVYSTYNKQQWDMFQASVRQLGFKGDPTQVHASNLSWALNYAAWRLKGHLAKSGGDVDKAYLLYNPNYKGPSIYSVAGVPKQYTPSAKWGETPTLKGAAAATTAAATKNAKNTLARQSDPYVYVTPTGIKTSSKLDAKHVLTGTGPNGPYPVTVSTFIAIKRGNGAQAGLDDVYFQWTGHIASNKDVAKFIKNSWSVDTLQRHIAYTDPNFYKSRQFKTAYQGYSELFAQVYGRGFTLDPKIVRDAIIGQWQSADFQAKIRNLPTYTKSNEFRGAKDAFVQVFQGIYGTPDKEDDKLISDAVLARWTPEQFQSYLQARPEYGASPAYQKQQTDAYERLTQLTGRSPIMEIPKTSPFKTAEKTPPADKRVAGGEAPTGKPHGTPYVSPLAVTSGGTFKPKAPSAPKAPKTTTTAKKPSVSQGRSPNNRAGRMGP